MAPRKTRARRSSTTKCIGVDGASTASGAKIAQYTCDGLANQRWSFVQTKPGYFRIVNFKSRKCVGVPSKSGAKDVQLQQLTCDSIDASQNWIYSK